MRALVGLLVTCAALLASACSSEADDGPGGAGGSAAAAGHAGTGGTGATGGTGGAPGGAGAQWWSQGQRRVVTYEFLERQTLPEDLTVDQIMSYTEQLGGADVLLCKGFHYYNGVFDESSWGYPRFRDKIAEIVPVAHAANIKVGVFGFVQRGMTYEGEPDYDKVIDVWNTYAQMGVDILFIDEESGTSGLDIPPSCLAYADDLRSRFDLPVGIFLYGAASEASTVATIAPHVDVIGEMGYNLYLDQQGDYNLATLTESWVTAAQGANDGLGYWTGAGIFDANQFPGTPFWQERYGNRTISAYFHDYLQTAVAAGATGAFFHSICRLEWWSPDVRAEVIAGVKQIFDELAAGP